MSANTAAAGKDPPSMRARRIAAKTILYVAMSFLAVLMIFPFYYSVVNSFRNKYDWELAPRRLWPESFSFANYRTFFELLDKLNAPMFKVLGNTAFITISIIVLSLFFCALAAYSLARLDYKGKKAIITVFFASMMVPGVVSMVPNYAVLDALGLTGSKWGLIIPGAFSIYGTLFLRAFFLTTPKEVAEAGRIDGAGELHIFFSFYLRMVLPGLITLGLFTFNGNWNSYLWPRIILGTNKSDWVLAIVIRDFQTINDASMTGIGPVMAASIITVLPTIALFLAGQKFFMENMAFAGIK
jgi:multiple sugar transport system permease protein